VGVSSDFTGVVRCSCYHIVKELRSQVYVVHLIVPLPAKKSHLEEVGLTGLNHLTEIVGESLGKELKGFFLSRALVYKPTPSLRIRKMVLAKTPSETHESTSIHYWSDVADYFKHVICMVGIFLKRTQIFAAVSRRLASRRRLGELIHLSARLAYTFKRLVH